MDKNKDEMESKLSPEMREALYWEENPSNDENFRAGMFCSRQISFHFHDEGGGLKMILMTLEPALGEEEFLEKNFNLSVSGIHVGQNVSIVKRILDDMEFVIDEKSNIRDLVQYRVGAHALFAFTIDDDKEYCLGAIYIS